MVKWNYLAAILIALAVLALSCSGSGGNLVITPSDEDMTSMPGLTADSTQKVEPANSILWGCYDIAFDLDSHMVDVVLNRTAMFTLNAVTFLNNNPAGVSFNFNGVNAGADFVDVDVDITITHPLGDARFNGYDVRGVFIGNGSGVMKYGNNLRYPVRGLDQTLTNADGYTRWFNPLEFPVPGIGGYTPGLYPSPGYLASATLNPYKYFGEGFDATGDLWTYLEAGADNTGAFLAGTSNTRNYLIRFPLPVPAVKYSYAVVADWECPDPGCHPSHCIEAVGFSIDDNSTLYHISEENNGGMLDLDISVFNWHAELTGSVMQDYTIFIESEVLNFPYEFTSDEMTPIGGGEHYSTYHVEIPADVVRDLDEAGLCVIVEDNLHDYSSPFGIPNNAEDESLAAFFYYKVPVGDEEPLWVRVKRPNGGEQWFVEKSAYIEWEANPDIDFVSIEMSFDSGATYPYLITDSTPNDGIATWNPIPVDAAGETNRMKITAVGNPDVYDESDEDFAVIGDWLHVTSPSGGESWEAGSTHEITWESNHTDGSLFIAYSKDAFISDLNWIVRGTPNDGSYTWENIPFDASDTVRVAILSPQPFMLGVSENDFSITLPAEFIHLITPNGGEEWGIGTNQIIEWDSGGIDGNISLYWSTDNFGIQTSTIAEDVPNEDYYNWINIPDKPTTIARVKVESVDNPTVFDTSDADFSIVETGWARTWGTPVSDSLHRIATDDDGNIYVTGRTQDDNPFCSAYLRKYNSAGDLLWNRTWDSEGRTWGYGLARDDAGNLYVTGGFQGTNIDFDPGPGSDLHTSDSGGDIYLSRFDSDGNFNWARAWGGIDPNFIDSGYGVAVGDSGVYVVGWFTGTNTDFDPGIGTDLHTASGSHDAFLSNFTTSGDFVWAGTWGGDEFDSSNGLAIDDSGRVFVCGEFSGIDVDFDPDPVGSATRTSISTWADAYLVWFNEFNTFQGVHTWGGTNGTQAPSLAIDQLGNILVSGFFSGTDVDFDPGTGTDLHSSNGEEEDLFLSQFDSTVTWQWSLTWGGTDTEHSSEVDTDALGNIFITGYFLGIDVDFDPGTGADLHSSAGNYDAFCSKFDSAGNYIITHTWGGTDWDYGNAVHATESGAWYVGGSFRTTGVEFAPTDSPCFEESDVHDSDGVSDAFLIKFMPDGCW